MPWLAILGNGSWMVGKQRFDAGIHEVSEEIAAKAQATGMRRLVICDEKPELDPGREPGPLKPEDFDRSWDNRGTQLRLVHPPAAQLPAEDEYSLPKDYPCGQCSLKFPSPGSRARHVEFHH